MWLIHEGMGWAATSISAGSYFCRGSRSIRMVQASASLVWIAYGIAIHSYPVIVANVIVAGLAAFSAWRPGMRPLPAGSDCPTGVHTSAEIHAGKSSPINSHALDVPPAFEK